MSSLKIYLAGAIRDDRPEDIEWRDNVIEECTDAILISPESVAFLNPLGGKTYNRETKQWLFHGINPIASLIVPHDFWCVDRSDIIIFNFLSLAEGYPSIGTLCEFGRATGRNCLRYSIIPKNYMGHNNQAMFRLHPFIEQNSAIIFNSVEECIEFLRTALPTLLGDNAYFSGYVNG